jgi:hypothetical protein
MIDIKPSGGVTKTWRSIQDVLGISLSALVDSGADDSMSVMGVRWSTRNKQPRINHRASQNFTIGPGMTFRSTRSNELNSKVTLQLWSVSAPSQQAVAISYR